MLSALLTGLKQGNLWNFGAASASFYSHWPVCVSLPKPDSPLFVDEDSCLLYLQAGLKQGNFCAVTGASMYV